MCLVDQMGVELGKVLAKNILAQLGKPEDVKGHDSSVGYLISVHISTPFSDSGHRRLASSTTTRNIGRSKAAVYIF